MEQKRPADIFQELLDYLWNGLGLEEKGWKRLKKGDFKKKMKNGLTYQIWFDRSRYNYIDYEIGHGNVEVGFSCIIKQGDDYLYSFRIEPTTGGSFFRMLTDDLRLNTGLLDTFLPLIKAHYLDFIDRFEADPVEALQPVCAPFTEAEDYKVSTDDLVKLKRIRKAAEQGEFDILLVFMYDRLGRNLNETPFIAEWFTKKGIHVWSVYEGEIIDGVDAERMLDYIRFWQTDEAQKL